MPVSTMKPDGSFGEDMLCRISEHSVDLNDCIPATSLFRPKPPPSPPPKPPPKKPNPPQASKPAKPLSASELTDLAVSLQPRLTYPKPVRQFFGGVAFVGGSLEATVGGVGGLLTAETGVGAAAGGFLLYHGVDTASSGFNTMVTGEESKTWTYRLGSSAASSFSDDKKFAAAVGSSLIWRPYRRRRHFAIQQIRHVFCILPYNPDFTIPATSASTEWKSAFPGLQIGKSEGYRAQAGKS